MIDAPAVRLRTCLTMFNALQKGQREHQQKDQGRVSPSLLQKGASGQTQKIETLVLLLLSTEERKQAPWRSLTRTEHVKKAAECRADRRSRSWCSVCAGLEAGSVTIAAESFGLSLYSFVMA